MILTYFSISKQLKTYFEIETNNMQVTCNWLSISSAFTLALHLVSAAIVSTFIQYVSVFWGNALCQTASLSASSLQPTNIQPATWHWMDERFMCAVRAMFSGTLNIVPNVIKHSRTDLTILHQILYYEGRGLPRKKHPPHHQVIFSKTEEKITP